MTNFLYRFAGLLTVLLLSTGVYAEDIQVDGAWTRATTVGRDSASVFMFITSKQDATLTGASSTASRAVELRTMEHKGSMMKTLVLEKIELPANKRMDMTSIHGYHLTLTGLNAPLKAGEVVPLTLNIKTADGKSTMIEVQAEIKPPRK
ncbi:MAG TPA: copper chaperone PCu(A)C [Gallionella sp.]|jgi:copper(I)-binding protein|nr:copper chaperone PCu(A)C [Gallionella sp.]